MTGALNVSVTFQITSRVRLEDLESLYSVLVRCVYRHNNDYDKTLLLKVSFILLLFIIPLKEAALVAIKTKPLIIIGLS